MSWLGDWSRAGFCGWAVWRNRYQESPRMSTFKVRIWIKILNTYKVNIVNFLDLQWYSGLSLLVIKDSFLVKSQWTIQLPKMCYILSLEEWVTSAHMQGNCKTITQFMSLKPPVTKGLVLFYEAFWSGNFVRTVIARFFLMSIPVASHTPILDSTYQSLVRIYFDSATTCLTWSAPFSLSKGSYFESILTW